MGQNRRVFIIGSQVQPYDDSNVVSETIRRCRVRVVRRLLLLLALLCFIPSVILLLNITAPNPTGRRTSSASPLVTGQGSGSMIGQSAEVILARDLRLPNNNDFNQRQCLCQNANAIDKRECNVCLPVENLNSLYRIPDFISERFIAESKNRQDLAYSGREVDQISDYVVAARALNIPLWVYVRVDTPVAPEFTRLVQSSGGDVVYYFTVPGYVDPVDDLAGKGMWAGMAVLGGLALLKWGSRRRLPHLVRPRHPNDPLSKAVTSLNTAQDFARRRQARLRREMDEEWNDL